MYLVDALKSYVSFTPAKSTDMEEEFTILRSMDISDFLKEAVNKATIRIDDDGSPEVYRIDVSWYHLFNMKMLGLQTSKFKNNFSLAKVVLSTVHSNAKKESQSSHKRLTSNSAFLAKVEVAILKILNLLPPTMVGAAGGPNLSASLVSHFSS